MRQKHITLQELYLFTWDFFIVHWKTIFLITGLFCIPGILALTFAFPTGILMSEDPLLHIQQHPLLLSEALFINLSALLYVIGTTLTTGGIYLFVKHQDQEQDTSIRILLRELFPLIPVLLLGMLLFYVLALPLFLLIIPGVLFSISSIFWIQGIMFSGKPLISAFLYSYQLVRTHWWRIFGYTCISILAVELLASIFSSTTDFIFTAWSPQTALGFRILIRELTSSFFIVWNAFLFIHIQHNFLKESIPHAHIQA